jgi:hypothetical protein
MVHHLRKGAAIASARRRLDGARTSSHNREHVRIERLVRPHLASLMHAARAPIPGIAAVRVPPPRRPPTHGPRCALLQPLSVLSDRLFDPLFSSSRPHTLPLPRGRYLAFKGATRAMMQRAACAPDLISRRARASLGRFSDLRRCAGDAAPRSSSEIRLLDRPVSASDWHAPTKSGQSSVKLVAAGAL